MSALRVAVIGAGYVGLVTRACFSERGIEVHCVDKSVKKIENLKKCKIPIYEPGLEEMVSRNLKAKRLRFLSNLEAAIQETDISFIAVGTPGRSDGWPNLGDVYRTVDEVTKVVKNKTLIVTKSTVPVGTARNIKKRVQNALGFEKSRFDFAANPEFLREGSAIDDFLKPDRVIIGSETDYATEKLRKLYNAANISPLIFTGLESAELIKHSANGFLATKIAFINQIADICERTEANVVDVSKGLGFDRRIGRDFLNAGPGFGGGCLPKDAVALIETAKSAGVDSCIIEAVVAANNRRKDSLAERVSKNSWRVQKQKGCCSWFDFQSKYRRCTRGTKLGVDSGASGIRNRGKSI